MERQQAATSTNIPPHAFVLKEQAAEGLVTIGYVQEDTAARFKPAYKVVTVNDAGEVVQTGFIIDSNQKKDLLLKVNVPETKGDKTYEYSIIGKLWESLSKAGNRYHRCKGMDGSKFEGRVFRMFPYDAKFAAGQGTPAATGTAG